MSDEKQTVDMDVQKLRNAVHEAHARLRDLGSYCNDLTRVHERYECQIRTIAAGAQSVFNRGVALVWAAMILNTALVLAVLYYATKG